MVQLKNSLTDIRFIKISLLISLLTLLFFGLAFGPQFLSSLSSKVPDNKGNGIGMAFALFGVPLILTLLQLVICLVTIYRGRHKQDVATVLLYLVTILTIPIAIFGFVMFSFSLIKITEWFY